MGEMMTAEEFIEHHGVMGMKWGKHKAKPTTSDIKTARKHVESQTRKLQDQEDKVVLAKSKSQATSATKKLNEMNASYLKNPDRATALRLTNGEKAAALALSLVIPGFGIGAGAGATARVAVRKTIEKRQASGHYDQQK